MIDLHDDIRADLNAIDSSFGSWFLLFNRN